jgi:hypothetical protein
MSDFNAATPGGTGDPMDANETLVKERFDAAVGSTSPDVVSLVGGGIAAGRGMRRRRRQQGVGGVLAVMAVAVGALTATGTIGRLFDSQGPASTDNGRLVQLQRATPRGLAAAVMSHTAGLGTLIGVGGTLTGQHSADAQMRGGLTAEVGYRTSTGVKVEVEVIASPRPAAWDGLMSCRHASKGTCARTLLRDGTARVVLQAEADGKPPSAPGVFAGPHILAVGIMRHDSFVVALETVLNSKLSPLGVAQLQTIATDPTVGMSTTAAFNAQGTRIAHFKRSLTRGSSSSSGASTAAPPSASATPHSAGPPVSTSTSAAPPS